MNNRHFYDGMFGVGLFAGISLSALVYISISLFSFVSFTDLDASFEGYKSLTKGDLIRNSADVLDLAAQRSMAASNRVATLASLGSLLLGVIGAGGIVWTLYETRRSANAAQDMVKADRAWVLHQSIAARPMARMEEPEVTIGFEFLLTFQNSGRTPAKRVRAAVSIREKATDSVADLRSDAPNYLDGLANIGLGNTCLLPSPTVSLELVSQSINSERDIYLYCFVEYYDIWEGRHETDPYLKVEPRQPLNKLVARPFYQHESFYYTILPSSHDIT